MRPTHPIPNGRSATIEGDGEGVRRRLDALQSHLSTLKAKARGVDPDSFWLNASELTMWGYRQIATDILTFTGPALDGPHSSAPETDSPHKTLDWGGGMGFLSYFLEGLGFRNTYYDFASGEPCADLVLSRLEGAVVSATGPVLLPFADSTFDVVVSCGVLEHVEDARASLAEVRRILKPSGLLFVYHFPNRWSYTEFLARKTSRPSHDVRLTKRAFLAMFQRGGFEAIGFEYKYLVPRNLVYFPRPRDVFSRHARGIFAVDRTLAATPGLRIVCTSLNAVLRRSDAP